MKLFRLIATGLAAVFLAVPSAEARDKVPTTVAEAKAQLDPWFLHRKSRRPSYRNPPGNVRAEDYHALFGNRVVVINHGLSTPDLLKKGGPHHALKVVFIGRDGRYVWCVLARTGTYRNYEDNWIATKVHRRPGLTPLLDPAPDKKGVGLSPLYDGATGEVIWYTAWKRRWWDRNVGHLQERLPRAVYTVCPDFPSAEELGVGINEKQTAVTYPDLVAQDPGRRVLRPDLVTPNPVEPRK